MLRALTLTAVVMAAPAPAADFTFSMREGQGELVASVIPSAGAVEQCVAKQPGPVVALLFVGHEGLQVFLHSAPKGTEDCILKVLRALDVSKAQVHDTLTIVAGLGVSPDLSVKWASKGLEVIDQDEQVAMKTLFDRREQRPGVKEGFAHGPLLRRCSPGEHVVLLAVGQGGGVTRVTGTHDACVTEVLKGLRFPEKGSARLKLRLD